MNCRHKWKDVFYAVRDDDGVIVITLWCEKCGCMKLADESKGVISNMARLRPSKYVMPFFKDKKHRHDWILMWETDLSQDVAHHHSWCKTCGSLKLENKKKGKIISTDRWTPISEKQK